MSGDELVLSVHRMCSAVRGCPDEPAIASVLRGLIQLLGADHWVYVTFMRGDESAESYRFLFGCPPAWCQEYAIQRWFLIDPLLLYSQRNSDPTLVSGIPVRTPGQIALMAKAKTYGFADGFVVPAHAATHARVGALYIAYEDATRVRGDTLESLGFVLRMLSNAVLDWMLRRIRMELIASTRLTEREIALLRYQFEGFTTKEIARIEAAAEHAINRQFGNILFKLGVSSRKEAASIARMNGLI